MIIYQTFKKAVPLLLTVVLVACGGSGSKSKETTKTIPFSIQGTSPDNGEKGVALDSKIKISFNKPISEIDQSSVRASGFSLKDEFHSSISGTFNFGGNDIVFTPNKALKPNTEYILTINKEIKDIKGKSLGLSQTIRFHTRAQPKEEEPKPEEPTKAFKVTSTVPSDNSVGVSLESKILVYFSQDVGLTNLNIYNVKLYDSSSNDEMDIALKSSNNLLTITPKAGLQGEKLYRVSLLKGIKRYKRQ